MPRKQKKSYSYVIMNRVNDGYSKDNYHEDDEVHIRVWSNNPRDFETACGLFTRLTGDRPYYADDVSQATCPKCIEISS